MKQCLFTLLALFLLHASFTIPDACAGTVQLPKTGQTTSYAARDDGALERGVAWPGLRFSDHGNGTVTDNMTGLMWSKNANPPGTYTTWQGALDYIKTINSQSYLGYSDWRLPNVDELESLVDLERVNLSLPVGHLFTNVQSSWYWSSSTNAYRTYTAWYVYISSGFVGAGNKVNNLYYVWPVRSGLVLEDVTLTVQFDGTGSGSVSSSPAGIDCNTGCSAQFLRGTTIILQALAAPYSYFSGWSLPCAGTGDCSITLDADASVTADFTYNTARKARIYGATPSYYATLADACGHATSGDIIQAWAQPFTEQLSVSKSITFKGGFDEAYLLNDGYSLLNGSLTITGGCLTVDKLLIK